MSVSECDYVCLCMRARVIMCAYVCVSVSVCAFVGVRACVCVSINVSVCSYGRSFLLSCVS